MRRSGISLVPLLTLAVLLTTCGGEETARRPQHFGNQFQPTADRPYSFEYPSEWTPGQESQGELAIGVEDSVGMVLEPVHPWGGLGGFQGPGVERMEVAGYEAYRMALGGDPGEGKGMAYRINADGKDVTVWFFANDPAAYDENLFEAIMSTFRFRQALPIG